LHQPLEAVTVTQPKEGRQTVQKTLVLDQGYQPHRVVNWQRAVMMLFEGKCEIVEEYDEEIRSVSISIKMPAVVRLLGRIRGRHQVVKFSRINVATRDDFSCQYCRRKLPLARLTYDHVLPRSQGGKTEWQNIVMACYSCNEKKANRTPAQAKMALCKAPVRPAFLPAITMRFELTGIPDTWASWLCSLASEAR